MAKCSFRGGDVRRLDVFGSGEKTQWLLIGGLLVLIIGSLVLFVMSVFGRRDTRPAGWKQLPIKCIRCDKEYLPEKEQERQLRAQEEKGGSEKPQGADCVKCGAKAACYRMIRCLKCGKFYEPKWIRLDRPPTEQEKERICPYCGANLRDWQMRKPDKK
jgi:hypothetical protein